MRTAIVFGASGFIGGFLLDDLLKNLAYEKVTAVVRKDIGVSHPKLDIVIGDYASLPSIKNQLVGDDIFLALGTTKKNTPDEKQYYEVDHDYPVEAARFAKENGARSVMLVSAVGPDPKSSVFYLRTKAATERDIIALDFDHTHIFRPSMLMGTRKENRPLEKLLLGIWPVVNALLVGPLSKFKGIQGSDLSKAMVIAASSKRDRLKIYEWKDIQSLLKESKI